MHKSMIHESMIHVSMMHVSMILDPDACFYDAANVVTNGRTDEQGDSRSWMYFQYCGKATTISQHVVSFKLWKQVLQYVGRVIQFLQTILHLWILVDPSNLNY